MATQPIPFISVEQYLEIERAAEFRSEYLNGQMFAMSGALPPHNEIVNSLGRTLHPQIRGRCRYYTTDLRLFVPATGLYTYPDLMVICGDLQFSGDRKDIVTNPGLIAEVLSNSTADYDRGGKFAHYRSIPSLRDYLTITQDSVLVEHWSRQGDGTWSLREFRLIEDVIRVAISGVEIRLADIYEETLSEPAVSNQS